LLRDLTRGHVWRIGSAKLVGSGYRLHYWLLGAVTVRTAIFPSLPPPMERQNRITRTAPAASGLPLSQPLRVRMNFPDLDWAYVEAVAPASSKAASIWALVHRARQTWTVVR
jgi:hypothetical protein